MRRTVVYLVVALSLNAHSQKIDEIDLTRPSPAGPMLHSDVLPKECLSPEFTTSNGAIVTSVKHPSLEIQLTILNEKAFAIGDRVKAEVVMKNVGDDPFDIPWTFDPNVVAPDANSLQNEYEEGWFEVELKGKPPIRLESESVSGYLYGSLTKSGTTLHLEPGQWIVAKFDFLMEQDSKMSALFHIGAGANDVLAHWRQVKHGWRRDGCKMESSYYSYDYAEETKPASIKVWNRPLTVIP
jgi:hypothetical protein